MRTPRCQGSKGKYHVILQGPFLIFIVLLQFLWERFRPVAGLWPLVFLHHERRV